MDVERRRSPRGPTKLWIAVDGIDAQLRLRAGNVSAGGVFFEHDKPIGVVNSRGYFNPLIAMIEHGIEHRFIPEVVRETFFIEPEPVTVIDRLCREWGRR